ncbi:MAG: amidohydrolase family protein [Wenzhouxiangellaceae bacterium]|nr:amidohydrolase family protein [Wenzhouxiangellaceae bacterium]
MNAPIRLILLIAAAVALAVPAPLPAQDETPVRAFVGATLHPVDGPAVENGTMLVRGERIVALGADVEVPADAEVVDLSGLHVFPGFVHPRSSLGLTEISSVAGTVDTAEMGSINAAIDVRVAFNHDSMLLPVNVAGGILTTHSVPSGGLIRGHSAVMRMEGWSWEDMVLVPRAGMHIVFPAAAADDDDNEDLAKIEDALDAARHWHTARAAAEAGVAPAPARNAQLEALGPLLDGEVPLFLYAEKETTIRAAMAWADEQEFDRLVIVGGPDLQYVAEDLAAAGVQAILDGVYVMPTRRWDAYDQNFVAAARLHEAGVKFAIGDGGGGFGASNARNLPFHAGSAAAFGLPKDAALKSVTLWPAEILGLGEELGSLADGKRATFFAATGDPLEPMTKIRRVWIDGKEYDLSRNRHRELYERYRDHIAETGD